jgi:predicted component of type VI protein secretion system
MRPASLILSSRAKCQIDSAPAIAFCKIKTTLHMAKITFVLEDGQEVVVPLTERVTIGRAEDNDVMVDDERISMQHAELLQNADGSIQVFDLKSESGTFVNGERQMSCTLLHGDKLAFGPLVGRLDLEDMEPATPKQPEAAPTWKLRR